MTDTTPCTLAVDVGGTQMRAALVSMDGKLTERRSLRTPQEVTCADALMALVGDLPGRRDAGHAVIGIAGRIDYRHGRLEFAPNLPAHWAGSLDQGLISDRLGIPAALANDADLAAVGEKYFGAGRDYEDIAYMTISTGIGAGVLLGGRLVAGHRSMAEVGHTIIDLCALQRSEPATLEELGSGTAVARRARSLGLPPEGARIVELVRANDADAIQLWNEVVSAIGIGVANLAMTFTPQAIIIGGGVGRNADVLLPAVRKYLDKYGPENLPAPVQLLTAELGDDAGLVGAAAWLRASTAQG